MINRALIGAAVGGAVAAGAVGLALGWSGTVSLVADATAPVASPATLPYHPCPGTEAMGRFQQGDRVYLTARDDSGQWVQVRSPENQNDQVWVLRQYVDPDAEVDLPLSECGIGGGELLAADAPTTTVADEGDPVDSTIPETSEPAPTTEVTEPPPVPTTTAPATTVAPAPTTAPPVTPPPPPPPAPAISGLTRTPATIHEIWQAEQQEHPNDCYTVEGSVGRSTISATIVNADTATMSWRVAGQTGSRAMTRSGTAFSATLGPFFETTIPSGTAPIEVTVQATGPGGTATAITSVTLTHCEGLG
jgi:hypothetical protein